MGKERRTKVGSLFRNVGHLLCLEGIYLTNGRWRNIQVGESEYGFKL
jgi:hypothetical protein